jgi:hypothetical protein
MSPIRDIPAEVPFFHQSDGIFNMRDLHENIVPEQIKTCSGNEYGNYKNY